jgi:hypothetical protein
LNYDAWLLERLNDPHLTRAQYMAYWHEYQARHQMHGQMLSDAARAKLA